MAGIDHTIIAFKNGKLMKDTVRFTEDDQCISLIPFSYNRDGLILGYDLGKSHSYPGRNWREKLAAFLSRSDDEDKFYSYVDKNVEIILCILPDCNVTFYLDSQNTYVMLGGYGHYHNPYTHFYERGYGEEFELKMATECYEWLCEIVLKAALETLPQYSGECEHHLNRLQVRLGFKSFWSMNEEERRHYNERRIGLYDPAEPEALGDGEPLFPVVLSTQA